MRTHILTMLAVLALASPTLAASLTCTVPAAEVARATELCDALRIDMRAKLSEWSLTVCADELLRRGIRQFEARYTERTAVAIALETNAVAHPSTVVLDACGDGEKESWEECDDGNLDDGDGCSGRCDTE